MPNDWRRFTAMSLLGGSLLGQRRYSEAESLVVQGYEGMKLREGENPGGQPQYPLGGGCPSHSALDDAWDKSEKAAEWKEKLGLAYLPATLFATP